MKIKCDFCENTATGNVDKFIDLGWSRAVVRAPVRRTITACPKHGQEASNEVLKCLPRKIKNKIE